MTEERRPGRSLRRFAITISEPSRTKQSFKDEVNVNSIVEKYNRTGQLPLGMRDVVPQYGDISAVTDYHQALTLVKNAGAAFAELPSHIRDACRNDPLELLQLAADPERLDQAVELGVVDPPDDYVPPERRAAPTEAVPSPAEGPATLPDNPGE